MSLGFSYADCTKASGSASAVIVTAAANTKGVWIKFVSIFGSTSYPTIGSSNVASFIVGGVSLLRISDFCSTYASFTNSNEEKLEDIYIEPGVQVEFYILQNSNYSIVYKVL